MYQNKRSFAVFVFVAALLSAGVGSAAAEQVPWHVKDAEFRIPVTVVIEEALVKMPPEVYLADLNPIEAKDLAFDRKTKDVVKHDIRTQEQKERVIADLKRQCAKAGTEYKPELYRPQLHANGSATFELKPEYKWFFCEFRGNGLQVFIDGTNVLQKRGGTLLETVAIPSGAKRLKIEANGDILRRAGFITRGPSVAAATLYIPGLDSTEQIPLIYDLAGRQVGCRILWAYPGEPMDILFDCSSGEKQYMVYLVPRLKQPARLDWAPKAGLILESRYPAHYDPAINTPEGFQELWDGADFIAGKHAVRDSLWRWYHASHTAVVPGAAISHSFLPFRTREGEATNFVDAKKACRASLALSRFTGFFHIPETQDYDFYFGVQPAGYLLIDDQVVSEWRYGEAGQADLKPLFYQGGGRGGPPMKGLRLKLEKGLHKLDFCQYGQRERFYAWFSWTVPDDRRQIRSFGRSFSVWEPLAEAATGAATRRDEKLSASFTWGEADKEWLGDYPAGDIVQLSLTGTLSPERDDAVFRWRFDDGHTAEGKKIEHVFFASGIRQVALDVLDGPGGKTIARAAGSLHVHVKWSNPNEYDRLELAALVARREPEFASVTPIREVLSLYEWSLQCEWPERRMAIGAALAGRIDEVIAEYPYDRLLDLARSVPMAAHFSAVEKLCKAVMDRAPSGSRHWQSAATTLADILVSVRDEPEKALQLLEKAEKVEPSLDLTGGWRTATAKQWYPSIPESGEIAGVTEGLNWSKASELPVIVRRAGDQGAWFEKEFHVPDSRRGKELVLELNGMSELGVAIWFNGTRLGTPAQWPRCNLVIPAEVQRYGETNRFLALRQPAEPPEWSGLAKRLVNYGFAGPPAEKDDPARRLAADALLMMGERDKAKEILLNLNPEAWPLGEETQLQLTADLRRIQRLAEGRAAEAEHALSVLDEWLRKHPMLRTVPGVTITKAEILAGMGDYARALTLAKQMLRMDLSETQREQVMLLQVKAMCKTGKMDAARDVYIQLKKIAPYSPATLEAREAITKAVLGK